MDIICENCGTANTNSSKFCIKCGSKLPEPEQTKYCIKCGNQLRAKDVFCDKCGSKQPSSIQTITPGDSGMLYAGQQPQQPQNQQMYQPQQSQGQQMYQPQQSQGQQMYQPQQPQSQQMYQPQQPQSQQMYQPQQPQSQQIYQPQQSQDQQMYQQAPQQWNVGGQTQRGSKQKIKGIYSNTGIIILSVITGILLLSVIIHGIYSVKLKNNLMAGNGSFGLFGGGLLEDPIPDTPKDLFVYHLSHIAPQFSDTTDNLGTNFFDMFVTINEIDTSVSSVNDTDITITLVLGEDSMSLASNQHMAYNADTHDTSLIMTGGLEGGDPSSCGYYYYDDKFLFVPTSASSPMVRYTMGDEMSELAKYAAVDRFANMVTETYYKPDVDWESASKNFEETALSDFTDDDFIVSTEFLTILNEYQECDAISISRNGHEAIVLSSAIADYLFQENTNEELVSSFDSMTDESSMSQETIDSYNMTLTVYSLKKEPVGIKLSTIKDGQEMSFTVINYKNGKEYDNQYDLVDPISGTQFSGWDTAVSSGGDNYNYHAGFYSSTDNGDTSESYNVYMDTAGMDTASRKTQTGTFTIETVGSDSPMSINGDIDYTMDYSGKDYTSTNNCNFSVASSNGEEMFQGTIVSNSSCKTGSADINPPEFIEGSGIDVGMDHQELLNSFGESFDSTLFSFNNRTIRTLAVYLQSMNVNTSSYIP